QPCPSSETLAAYVEGVLPTAEKQVVAAHFLSCGRCFKVYTESLQEFRAEAANFWRANGLSVRASNALARVGVTSWEKLGSLSLQDLLLKPGIGKGTVTEIREVAAAQGITLQRRRREKLLALSLKKEET